MYKINTSNNNVVKLEQRLFRELHIREREHLQEWIAKNPEMLGEELLIIQKEFDGFNDTNERLDLLAVDKVGGLVVIENKLDDTGRNVVWQALKYASYCSTLTTNQILKIYQDYLDKWQQGEEAKQNLLDFLERNEEDLLLNRNDQRIIFVANNYRKEVTSTVLWLLNHDIQVQCFRATPYSMGDEMFLQMEQIIPLPETKQFMIDAKEKEKEEQGKSKTIEQSEIQLLKFWNVLKAKLAEQRLDYLDRVSSKPHYSIGFWKGKAKFAFCIGRLTYRVELYFSDDSDKCLIDALAQYKGEIQSKHKGSIDWERLENKKASRIKYEMPKEVMKTLNGKFREEKSWAQIVEWYASAMKEFYGAIFPYLELVQRD
jgi:hypothetical protein